MNPVGLPIDQSSLSLSNPAQMISRARGQSSFKQTPRVSLVDGD
jgi:hypothetical protein